MAVLKGYVDRRTEEQRRNNATQKARPGDTQDTARVATGPTAGKADEYDDNPAPPVQEEIPVIIVPFKPTGGITDDAGDGSGVKRQPAERQCYKDTKVQSIRPGVDEGSWP